MKPAALTGPFALVLVFVFALVVLLALGCESQPRSGEPPPTAPLDQLDRLDQRRPLPLLPQMAEHQKQNMRDHLAVVQEVVEAAAQRDFERAARAARRMGYSDSMAQMCEHMGAGAPGFTERALSFHHSADRVAEAAERADSAAMLTALGETLSLCTGCHATYKQKLVSALP